MSARAVLSKGTVVEGQPKYVARAVGIDHGIVAEEEAWVDSLRARGIKASHPDDGWVDRDINRVHLMYPHFNQGLAVGDLLVLGNPCCERTVRITGSSECRFATRDMPRPFYWHFQEINEAPVGDDRT